MKKFLMISVCVAAVIAVMLTIISAEMTETPDQTDQLTDTGYVTEEETAEIPAASAVFSVKGDIIVKHDFRIRVDMAAENLRGGKFEVRYDPDKLEMTDMFTYEGEGMEFFSKADEGSVSVLFYTDDVFNGEMTVLTVHFRILSAENGETVMIGVENAEISDGLNDVHTAGAERLTYILLDPETTAVKITETAAETEPPRETETVTETEKVETTEAETDAPTEPADTEPPTDRMITDTAEETESGETETELTTAKQTEPAATETRAPNETETEPAADNNGKTVLLIIAAALVLAGITVLIASFRRKK